MDNRLLRTLVCSLCKGTLQHDRVNNELVCHAGKLAYPIRDGIPVMLAGKAHQTMEGTLVGPA